MIDDRQPHLVWLGDRWGVAVSDLPKPVTLDFTKDVARRARQGGETLAKACGAGKGLRVLDATAGLGRDALLLQAAGAKVTACERSAALRFWLQENLHAAGLSLEVSPLDAVDLLANESFDVIYLDPMFPHKAKSAAVGAESRVLQAFAAPPSLDEETQLLENAIARCVYRVVVKRPIKAPPLAERAPSASLKGKAVRFDIYGVKKLP